MRAQIWSFDAVASIIVFLVAFGLIIFAWGTVQNQTVEQAQLVALESRAHGIAEGLLRTPGLPVDWNAPNVQTVGIAQEENVINRTLLIRFLALPESTAASRFGVPNAAFRFRVLDVNGSVRLVGGQNATTGTEPFSNATIIVPVLRFVLLDGDLVKVELTLWKPF